MRTFMHAAACAALLLLGACARDDEAADGPDSVPDQVVLDNLRDAGSNLLKPHDVDFSFYFPDAGAAQRFYLKVMKHPPFKNVTLDGGSDGEWLVEVTRTFVPSLAEIERNSKELRQLAEAEGGEFDGWGAAVVN